MTKKKQKKGVQKPKCKLNSNVGSAITQALQRFCLTHDEVFTFEADLSKRERALVHEVCRKMGMTSKSSGHGDQRRVSVYKSKLQMETVKFSEKTKTVLDDLFSMYPPDDGELGKETVGNHHKKADKPRRRKDDIFWRPSMTKEELTKKVGSYTLKNVANMKKISERSKLPIASFEDVITSTVESHQVVLISGETGCGKTTQVPQFLLDYMWGKGETCKIVCTQPRRISAVSVSERISYERGENVGSDIGYKIRLESKGGRHSSIVLCTNGILLRVLISEGLGKLTMEASRKSRKNVVSDLTHIIVDEVHERDRYSDFILTILRDLLPSYPHLRLILMSATIDAERFSKYFGGCPIISVPGFTYPVKNFYLEDVLSIVKSSEENHLDDSIVGVSDGEPELTEEDKLDLDESIDMAWLNDEFDPLLELVASGGSSQIFNYQHSVTGLTPLMVLAGKGRVSDVCMLLSFGATCELQAKDGSTALELAERGDQKETAEAIRKHLESSMSNSKEERRLIGAYLAKNSNSVDVRLIEQLLGKICLDSKEGAILVFLPGWDDISKTRERLSINPLFKDASKFLIISLHSMVPSKEQKKVFRRPPPGCRKIILSTNIAETAITIDDVVYVIDSGWMKEKSYDPYSNVSTFQSSWISKASAKQREGRAGRCQPGICYHLYSKFRASSLPDFQVPEIKRMPIEELCLQVKLLDPNCKIEDFLQKTLDPPVFDTIRNAILVLQDIGALSLDEKLTELGKKLGSLPVHPVTSKMLIFAILMNCLGPALTLACASDYKDPFTLPMLPSERKKAAAAKAELASLYGGHSDQLAVVAAFDCWKNVKGRGQEVRFCSKYYISSSTMTMLSGMRRQLEMELVQNGFIPEDVSTCNLNACDPGILHAVLVAGLYPMVGRLLPPQKKGKRAVVETGSGSRVLLHPQSLNFELSLKQTDSHPLIVYDEVTRGDGGTHIRNCTIVGPLPLLMVAKDIAVAPAKESNNRKGGTKNKNKGNGKAGIDETAQEKMDIENKSNQQPEEMIMSSPDNSVTVVVDRWLQFWSKALDIAQLYCLRERLSSAILFKVKHPNGVLPPVLGASMHALACILSYDGLSGISLESVEMLTSMVNATEIGHFAPGRSIGTHKKVSWFHKLHPNYNDFTVPEANGTSILNDPLSQNLLPTPDFRTANPSDPSSPYVRTSPNSVYARSTPQSQREHKPFKLGKLSRDQDAAQQQQQQQQQQQRPRDGVDYFPRPPSGNPNTRTTLHHKNSTQTYSSRERPVTLGSDSPSLRSKRSDISSPTSIHHPAHMGFVMPDPNKYTTVLPTDIPSPITTMSDYQQSEFIEGWTAAQGRSSTVSSPIRGRGSMSSGGPQPFPGADSSSPPAPRETILDRAFQLRCIPGSEQEIPGEEKLTSLARFDALMREADEKRRHQSQTAVAEKAAMQSAFDVDDDSSEEEEDEEEEDDDDDDDDDEDQDDFAHEADGSGNRHTLIPPNAQRALEYFSSRPDAPMSPRSPVMRSSPANFSVPLQAPSRPHTAHSRMRPNVAQRTYSQPQPTDQERLDVFPSASGKISEDGGSRANGEKRTSGSSAKRLSFTEFTRRLSSTSSLLLVQNNTSGGSSCGSSEFDPGPSQPPRGTLNARGLPPRPRETEREEHERRCGWRNSVGFTEGGLI